MLATPARWPHLLVSCSCLNCEIFYLITAILTSTGKRFQSLNTKMGINKYSFGKNFMNYFTDREDKCFALARTNAVRRSTRHFLPACLGGQGAAQPIHLLSAPACQRGKSLVFDASAFLLFHLQGLGCSSVVGHLPCMCKALGSIPSTLCIVCTTELNYT